MSDYPRMLYHADGRNLTVDDEAAEKAASGDGFGRELTPVAREAPNPGAATVQPSGQLDLANMIADIIVARLSAKPSDEAKRGPGRPRKETEDGQQ